MRGTWQGSGTWQTSGPDPGLLGLAALVVVLYIVAEIVLQLIWYIAAFLAAVLIGAVVGAVLFRRSTRKHAAELEATRPARLAAATPRREVPAAGAPAIGAVYNFNFYGTPEHERATIIRTAIERTEQP